MHRHCNECGGRCWQFKHFLHHISEYQGQTGCYWRAAWCRFAWFAVLLQLLHQSRYMIFLKPIWRLKNSISNYTGDIFVIVGTILRKGLAVIHRQSFHLFIQRFLQPWAESACANAGHYLSFKGIMTHHPLFLLAPSKVIPSPASHSLIRIQRLQENLSHLLSQVPLKRYFTAVEHFIIYCTCPQCVAVQEDSTTKARQFTHPQGSVPCSGHSDKMLFPSLSRKEIHTYIRCRFSVVDTKTGQSLINCSINSKETSIEWAYMCVFILNSRVSLFRM